MHSRTAQIRKGRPPARLASFAGVLGTSILRASAFRAVAGPFRATVSSIPAAGVLGNYLDFLCFSLEWGKREGGEAIVALSFYIFEGRSGSSDGFRAVASGGTSRSRSWL
jgi:hypothetical protein